MSLPALYESQFGRMVRVATVLVGDRAAAEDIVQDAFVSVGRHLSGLRGSEIAYLHRSVVNGCRDFGRRHRAAQRRTLVAVVDVAGADADAAERAQHQRVLQALDRLPARQRQCVVLRYYAGLSDTEVAAATGIGLGTVKTHIRRGLAALRTSLEDER